MLLNEDLKKVRGKVKVLSREPVVSNYSAKWQLDFVCDYDGMKINIEFNRNLSTQILRRNLVYVSEYIRGQYTPGNNQIKDTIQYNFVVDNFNRKSYIEEYASISNGKKLNNGLRIIIIDLAKVKNMQYTECGTRLKRFCKMLVAENKEELNEWIGDVFEDMETKKKTVELVNGLYPVVTEETYDERQLIEAQLLKTREYLDIEAQEKAKNYARRHKKEWLKEGEAKGEARGEIKKQEEIAKAMLKDKVDKNIIAKYTKLPISQIMSFREL